MPDILDSVKKSDLEHFKRDFKQMMRVAVGMDKDYGKVSKDFDFYLPKYKKFIKVFNKKYKNIFLKLRVTEAELKLQIYIKEKDVLTIFNNVASKLAGFRSIGASGFGIAEVSDARKFQAEVSKVKDRIYISYYEPEGGSNTIYLEHHKRQKMVELHYNAHAIGEGGSPEFKLIAYYAVKEGIDKKINLFDLGAAFGFTELLSDEEKREWLDEFDPTFHE